MQLTYENEEAVAGVRQALLAAGYNEANIYRALGTEVFGSSHRRADAPLYLRRLSPGDPLHLLIRLFALAVPAGLAEARAALGPETLEHLQATGMVAATGDAIQATVGLSSYDGLFFTHDRYDREWSEVGADHVLNVNPSSLMLANLTVRGPVGAGQPASAALDVGTGCGIQALLAARHAARVVGVDTNPRALRFAAFNARLNGLDNVTFRQGSLFEPVAGERFDLVVSNPPYVISPESRYIFRDSGLPGDTICRELLRQAPDFLEEGGFACVLCNWAHRSGDGSGAAADAAVWTAPLRAWVAGSGCDALLFHFETQDPLTYAATWNRQTDPAAYGAGIDRWLAYYRELDITHLSLGAVILRRRRGPGLWVRAEHLPNPTHRPCSADILRLCRAEDYLAQAQDGRMLLDHAFRLAGDHRLVQQLVFRDGAYQVEELKLQQAQGLGFSGTVDAYTLRLLSRCDGRYTLGELVADLVQSTGGDPAQVTAVVVEVVRQLVALGFLLPPEDTGLR